MSSQSFPKIEKNCLKICKMKGIIISPTKVNIGSIVRSNYTIEKIIFGEKIYIAFLASSLQMWIFNIFILLK